MGRRLESRSDVGTGISRFAPAHPLRAVNESKAACPGVHAGSAETTASTGRSSVRPSASSGRTGVVIDAFYATDGAGDANETTVMGAPVSRAQTFTHRAASGVVHTGAVCTNGDSCSNTNDSRDLLDEFGVATEALTNRASIVYTSDQPEGTSSTTTPVRDTDVG
jgi:hypothetical protein